MIISFSSITCAFDCEWVPCPDTARRILGLPSRTSDRDAMNAVWRHYAREGEERHFIKLVLSKVVSIAAVMRTVSKQGEIRLDLFARGVDECSEGELIGDFLETVASHKMQLWGFNSSGSDLPILKQRALVLGVSCPTFNDRPDKPWEGYDYHNDRGSEAHMDIMTLVAGFARGAARPSLNELAVASGIPGKLHATGADVADMYLAGNVREIVAYNETDALTTHLLMLQLAHHTGKLDGAGFASEVQAVQQLIDGEIAAGKDHMAHFKRVWDGYQSGEDVTPTPSGPLRV